MLSFTYTSERRFLPTPTLHGDNNMEILYWRSIFGFSQDFEVPNIKSLQRFMSNCRNNRKICLQDFRFVFYFKISVIELYESYDNVFRHPLFSFLFFTHSSLAYLSGLIHNFAHFVVAYLTDLCFCRPVCFQKCFFLLFSAVFTHTWGCLLLSEAVSREGINKLALQRKPLKPFTITKDINHMRTLPQVSRYLKYHLPLQRFSS